MRKLALFLMLAVIAMQSHAQPIVISSLGNEFYCMVMKYSGGGGISSTPYIRLFLSSPYNAVATITIENPPFSQTVNIVPNVVTTVELPAAVEVGFAGNSYEVATRQAIHIVADTDISVYEIYHKQFSTDSYMALPVMALGTEHIAACYATSVLGYAATNQRTASEIGIVAVADNTVVTITPAANTATGHLAGVPYSVTLSRGDTYLVYGDPNVETNDLTGTSITSTIPIVVLSGHDRTEIPQLLGRSRDCLVEQIPPNSTLGTSFITVPFEPRRPAMYDVFRVIAPIDSTTITINGTLVATKNAGQFYEFEASTPQNITSNNPVLVAQYAISATDTFGIFNSGPTNGGPTDPGTPWDPAMMIVPPTQQFLSKYIFANSIDAAFDSSYVNVVIPDGAASSLLMDGAAVAKAFTSIPGSGFSYAQIPDAQGSHYISASAPFGIYVYGFGHADSYANTGGAAFRTLNGLLVTTSDLNFGSVTTDTCHDSIVVFGNQGKAPITIWKMWLADTSAGDFTITSGGPPFSIPPGDTHVVHIKFCPSAVGIRGNATLRFSSNAVERPVITIHGVGKKIGVDADIQVLDYLQVLVNFTKDSTFTLINIGAKTALFAGLSITGTNAGDFILKSPVGGFTLLPGTSQVVTVTFMPTAVGVRKATISTTGSAGFFASVDLVGEGVLPGLGGVPDSIDYLNVKVMQTKDSLLTAKSIGKAAVSIGGYGLYGPDANQFVIVTGVAPRVLPPGDTLQVNVQFKPTSAGVKIAELGWIQMGTDNTPFPLIKLRGNAVMSSVGLGPKLVDYKNVKIGKQKDSVLTTTNTGIVDADIHGYALAGTDPQDFVIVKQTTPATLPPQGSQLVTAAFKPLTVGAKTATLIVHNDGNTPDTIATLIGNARLGLFNITTATDTIMAHIGDTISVPVKLIGPLDGADINGYRVLLGFDSTMLYPLAVRRDAAFTGTATFTPTLSYVPGVADVSSRSDSTLLGDGTLYYIDCLVLLGDAMQTPLTFSAARYKDISGDTDAVNSAFNHGLFMVINACGDSTNLILSSAKPLTLSSINPNPLNADALVAFDVPALGPVHLTLYDMLGREAVTLVNEERSAGHYATVLHASTLSNGAYTLVLQAGRFRETQRVEVVR